MLAMLPGPSDAFCVDVKPRNSSAESGINEAPPTPAAIAIRFGRLTPPSKPPPANPRRMLVGFQKSSCLTSASEPWPIASRWSLRSRITASLSSRIVASGSLWNRNASCTTRTSCPAALDARTSIGRCCSACFGTNRRRYGSPQPTVMPRPAGVAGKRRLEIGQRGTPATRGRPPARSARGRASASPPGGGAVARSRPRRCRGRSAGPRGRAARAAAIPPPRAAPAPTSSGRSARTARPRRAPRRRRRRPAASWSAARDQPWAGSSSTRLFSIFTRSACTISKVSGSATCWLTVYSEPSCRHAYSRCHWSAPWFAV